MCEKDDKIKVGNIVVSLRGHDEGRRYLVIQEIDKDFVLVCDGEYRKIDNPKQKRKKHLKFESSSEPISAEVLSDGYLRKLLK